MKHSPGFLSLVQAAQAQVQEISLEQAKSQMESLPETVLMDVREDHEWLSEHAAGAVHLGKGILERDIETRFPDRQTPIIMYCGGGYRSVLTAEIAQRMGYEKVCSLEGGFRAMVEGHWPMETPDQLS